MHYIIAMIGGLVLGVYRDATKHRIGKISGESGGHNRSAGRWAALSILLIPAVTYLMNRKKLIARAQEHPVESLHGLRNTVIIACVTGLLVFVFSLSGTGGSIEGVKSGVLAFNQATTVGQALDGYGLFHTCTWHSETTTNGMEIVSAIGELDIDRLTQAVALRKAKPEKLEAVFQFAINLDGSSFEYKTFALRLTKDDGTAVLVDAGQKIDPTDLQAGKMTVGDKLKAAMAGETVPFEIPDSEDALERVYNNEPLL